MGEILFEDGPLLGEITSLYQPDQMLPLLGQRYHGEVQDVYGSHGYEMTRCVVLTNPEATLAQALVVLGHTGFKLGQDALHGPVVSTEGRIMPGLGIWERRQRVGRSMLRVS